MNLTPSKPIEENSSIDLRQVMAEQAAEAGIKRIHVVSWRDFEDPEAGGSEEHAYQFTKELQLAGLDIVHHTGAVANKPRVIWRNGVKVIRRGGKMSVFAATAFDSLRGKMGPADGLIEVFHGMPLFAPLWFRGPRVAVLHHVHLGTWHQLIAPPLDKVGDFIESRVVPVMYRNAAVATLAPSTRIDINEKLRIPMNQIRVARPGIDPKFSPGGEKYPAPLVVGVARLMPQKGVADLIESLAETKKAVPNLEAVLVGDGPQREELEALVAALHAGEWIRFAGRVNEAELVEWYRKAWVVASASHKEGFGLTLTEAAACGTPCVATEIPGHIDAAKDGVSGLLAKTSGQFAENLTKILTDDALRRDLSKGALGWAAEFSWQKCAAAILQTLCEEALGRPGKATSAVK